MEHEVQYEIQNANGEKIYNGYAIAESVDDDEPEIYVVTEQGFPIPESVYAGESVAIDVNTFLEAIWDGKNGEKYEYKDNSYKIIIN